MSRVKNTIWTIQVVLLACALILGSFETIYAQSTTGTLTGTVADASGAVVPGANVVLKNEGSGDIRRTVSNGEGYFTFSAVPPATYTITVDAKGFQNWQQAGVTMNAGDKRNISDIALIVGTSAETVEVSAAAAEITTVDSGEKSAVITTKALQNVAVVGRNAAEFIKIMPGMAITSSTENRASFTGEAHGTGSGPIGSFSANGQRTGALDITSDGAHIIDPGCNCGQAVDVNVDMTQEMKVMTSNFGADAAKGPILISAVGKSGTSAFHRAGLPVCPPQLDERQRLAEQRPGHESGNGPGDCAAPRDPVYVPGRKHRRPSADSRDQLQQEPR